MQTWNSVSYFRHHYVLLGCLGALLPAHASLAFFSMKYPFDAAFNLKLKLHDLFVPVTFTPFRTQHLLLLCKRTCCPFDLRETLILTQNVLQMLGAQRPFPTLEAFLPYS